MSEDTRSIDTGQASVNPTLAIKADDVQTLSETKVVTDFDFKRFIYTGIYAIIDLPLEKNNQGALLSINTDGFIPPYNIVDGSFNWGRILTNLFPVQRVTGAPAPNIHIFQETVALPIQHLYLSHRGFSGSVGVGMRISSNFTQTGNLLITHATGVQRFYYPTAQAYSGLQSMNTPLNPVTFSPHSFTLADLSINRQVNVVSVRKDNVKYTDLAQKLSVVGTVNPLVVAGADIANIHSSQFVEDLILISSLNSLPSATGNQITISFFFDYSRIQFYEPMYPVIPNVNDLPSRQILKVSETIEGKPWGTVVRPQAAWLPGP